MNSNGNRSFSDSNPNGFAHVDPGSSSYLNQQLPLNPGTVQWSPQSSLFPPFPPQMQISGWTQQQQLLQQHLPAQIPNGMAVGPAMPVQQPAAQLSNNLASLLPANILQDVFRMSVPVGSSPDDDSLLVQVLKGSVEKGQTYKQAIETLHGVNNHAANLWKDYYLDHKHRIDSLVSPLADPPVKTVKKPSPFMPSPSRPQSNNSSRAASSSHVPQARRTSVKKERDSPQPLIFAAKAKAPSKRRTINSITAHEPTLNLKLLPPQADIKLPDPPSRSPTPPTKVVRGANGNRYTQEDKSFFIKFILWELQKDPNLTKHELCAKLAEKVPSHSAESWKSHWSGQHELADKIYASFDQHSPLESVSESAVAISRPKYAEDSDSESESKTGSSSGSESETDSIFDDLEDLLTADSADEGESGGSYTRTDMRNIVLFIADFPEDALIPWAEFQEKHPQRSDKSWQQYYRRNDKEIHRYVRKYRKRDRTKTSSALPPQRGRPSWASNKSGPLPSALKRKVSSGYDGNFKRMKEEIDDDDDLY